MLTKTEEIKILQAAIKKLGNDSYLGPQLALLVPYIESQIRADIMPDILTCVQITEKLLTDNQAKLNEMEVRIRDLDKVEKEKQARVNSLDRELYDFQGRARSALSNLRELCAA